ncbi:MAG TPA: hypothetical protein VEU47_18195 [Candidatus Cybelea sp.]|nr:hypothetical protein [Candidatus Cybelea sp.]
MADDTDTILDAIVALVPALLNAMEALGFIGRHLHPPQLNRLVTSVGARDAPVLEALEAFRKAPWPDHLQEFRAQIEAACASVCEAFDGLRAAAKDPDGVLQAYRALRHGSRALETLYPVASALPPVSQFYLDAEARSDKALLARLDSADATRRDTGVMHAQNERGMRGGFSVYVPEYYDASRPHPLVMALHGGRGHGRDFLWTWIRSARSRGAILVCPTALGDTWSLMEPTFDGTNVERILTHVRENWNVDGGHMLLTGMSDGGTFTYVSGLLAQSPFTHLAPVSSSFHPLMMEVAAPDRVEGLPVYIVHGKLDWMFPVDMARSAEAALEAAGANVSFREIADLSHTYPRDENPRILDWLLNGA